jgi:outer membrane protein assembly factor BamA
MAQTAPVTPPPAEPRRVELGIVPLVGGDTDVGLGFGQLSTIAALDPDYKPYRWAVESAAFISFKARNTSQASLFIPYQDYYVQWTAPFLMNKRLRLEARPSFTRETTQRFYGLGNASRAPPDDVPSRDFYGRTHPMVWARARYRIWDDLHVGIGAYYTQNWLDIPPQGTLAQQMNGADPLVREILTTPRKHGVLILETLALYDSRDNEIDSETGQFHQIKLRVSPAVSDAIPYSYRQINFTTRVFYTLTPGRLVLAARVVGDVQLGHPPFYELARYDDTYALGGVNGVRGVPGQRYYGKVKVFGNVELRSQLTHFTVYNKQISLGLAAFFDAGRAWTELAAHPELDGTGWGIKYGIGGGLRLQEGKTFVVRADLAWSPDARPVGGYVGAGQMF